MKQTKKYASTIAETRKFLRGTNFQIFHRDHPECEKEKNSHGGLLYRVSMPNKVFGLKPIRKLLCKYQSFEIK